MTGARRYPVGILAAACVPWNEDFTFAEDAFRRQVRHILGGLTRDLYIFGTAGEGYAVSERQFDEICRVFREETDHADVRAMVGVISLSLGTVIDRIGRAREQGFRHFQISLPSWGALSDGELRRFFKEVCDRFTDCAFLHYNLMRSKRLVTPDEYAILASEHPNLVATKNSTGDIARLLGLLRKAPQLTHFFTETGYAYASQLGDCGLLISMASTNFAAGKAYFQAGQSRDAASLLEMQSELTGLIEDMIGIVGPEAHMDGAFDKMFCRIHDPSFPLRLLPPYNGISDHTFEKVVMVIREKHSRWI